MIKLHPCGNTKCDNWFSKRKVWETLCKDCENYLAQYWNHERVSILENYNEKEEYNGNK